jgi:hypothetical protein
MFLPFCQWLAPYYAPHAWFLTPILSIIACIVFYFAAFLTWFLLSLHFEGVKDEKERKQKKFSFFQ